MLELGEVVYSDVGEVSSRRPSPSNIFSKPQMCLYIGECGVDIYFFDWDLESRFGVLVEGIR